jgi:lantibiotic modifying enzyme
MDFLEPAKEAARWIAAQPVSDVSLYSGRAGIVVFLVELADATGDTAHRSAAEAVADSLLDDADGQPSGLYDGVAGLAFALEVVNDGERLSRAAAMLRSRAQRAGRGVLWSDSADIFGGAAGIGLVLLRAARALPDADLLDLAAAAGIGLIDGNHHRAAGMPNFSHGAAGVSYFLATLFRETRDIRFKAAALLGAESLLAIADTRDGGCLIHHQAPGPGEPPLHYLGWCHGPVGTARLFHRLSQITGDTSWSERVRHCARSIATSGIPGNETPGLWNNAGQCCGLAGVADFFFDLHHATGDPAAREFAERVTRHVLAKAERAPDGLTWTHAEHRKRPDELEAQAGYMQGAAGIGALFLHASRGRTVTFPDSPWS